MGLLDNFLRLFLLTVFGSDPTGDYTKLNYGFLTFFLNGPKSLFRVLKTSTIIDVEIRKTTLLVEQQGIERERERGGG